MKKILPIFFFIFYLSLSACNLPDSQITPTNAADAVYTAAAQTVSAQLTAGAIGQVSVSTQTPNNPISTVESSATSTLGNTAQSQNTQTSAPSATAQVCDRADFVQDVTIPDGTVVSPGDKFTKTWRLRNTGTCTWTTGYAAVFDRDNLMGALAVVPLPNTVPPGQTVDISVELTAPNNPGKYTGNWKLRNDKGTVFGLGSTLDKPFYVVIEVAATLFAVTGVTPSIDPATFTGACNPVSIKFKADIRVNKAGTVQYHWEFSDSTNSPVASVTYTEAGTKSIEYVLTIKKDPGSYTGWGVVYIDDPNHQEFGKVNYTLTCQ